MAFSKPCKQATSGRVFLLIFGLLGLLAGRQTMQTEVVASGAEATVIKTLTLLCKNDRSSGSRGPIPAFSLKWEKETEAQLARRTLKAVNGEWQMADGRWQMV